jgi:uncharacterized DUF497 family protein
LERLRVYLTWDEPKRQSNLDKHGLDFVDVTWDFLHRAVIVPTKLGRFLAVGTMNAKPVTVVFSRLGGEGLSIVSMRPSSKKERAYGA